MKIRSYVLLLRNSIVVKNSIWGLVSSLFQNLLLSIFFIIIARNYTTFNFAQFLIATTFYQIIAAFSTLGLGQWFVREYLAATDKEFFVNMFLKIQVFSGLIFYVLNVILVYAIYDGSIVRSLAIILGLNVIFDNIIFAIKNLNIANFAQKKTFIVLVVDAMVKLLIGISLLVYPFSIITLSVVVIIARFATLFLLVKTGAGSFIGIESIRNAAISLMDVKLLLKSNWPFIIIGSVSIVYWRIASIIISKVLTDRDLVNYEVSFKVFLLAQLVPLILSSTVYPSLIKLFDNRDNRQFSLFYERFYFIYLFAGLFSYTFIYSFSEVLIPFAFGPNYSSTFICTTQMFLTMLVFPTFLLQANMLVAMKLEKWDMVLNVIGIGSYLLICSIALYFNRSLAAVNYSIFISFVIMHICQDGVLISKGITSLRKASSVYFTVLAVILGYRFVSAALSPYLLFFSFWGLIFLAVLTYRNRIISSFRMIR